MSLSGTRTYVGFGLGAIQTGLFLYEAVQSGHFSRLVVAEVIPQVVQSVKENNGYLAVNIARPNGVEVVQVGPVEVLDPAVESDRDQLIEALAGASEIGTAVPGVSFYTSSGEESLSRLLARGLLRKAKQGGPRAVIYTAENHNHAAEILQDLVLGGISTSERQSVTGQVRFLNTVIGKMSGVISDPIEIEALALQPMTPFSPRAFLVEAFNHILISQIDFNDGGPAFERGLSVFVEKDHLLPFEEAKLFGHNATHALAAYLGSLAGVGRIADLVDVAGMMAFLREAFIEESGAALIHRYASLDPLFTTQGFAGYADDLLARMVNPWLADTIERVGRDTSRKLGWDDRLIGTIRLCLAESVNPQRYALGAAAALIYLDPALLSTTTDLEVKLRELWGNGNRDPEEEQKVNHMVNQSLVQIRNWQKTGQDFRRLLFC